MTHVNTLSRLAVLSLALLIPGSAAPSSTDAGVACNAPPPPHAEIMEQRVARKRGTMGMATRDMVATSHALATQVGRRVLAQGGNAVDAFVASVLVEDMVLPGVTSTAGLAGFLFYDAQTKKTVYIDGAFRTVHDPSGLWSAGAPMGRAVLLPGAPFALIEGQRRFGHLPLPEVLRPVIKLAQGGFPIDALFASSIRARASLLRESGYGTQTFFRAGEPLKTGDVLRLPEVARTLTVVGKHGADEFRTGAWAKAFIKAVNAAGGGVTAGDLEGLKAGFVMPLTATYRGRQVVTSAGASFGGAKLLLALKTLEHGTFGQKGPLAMGATNLALLIRAERAVEAESWIYDPAVRSDPSRFHSMLEERQQAVWAEVQNGARLTPGDGGKGPHSSAVIVVDGQGNIAAGVHTIESLNWGAGIFVGGFPLTAAASILGGLASKPSSEVQDPLSMALVFRDDAPRVALAVYGTGEHPADVQVLTNVLDFGMSAEQAVLAPRLGWLAYDITRNQADRTRNLLDLRVPSAVTCATGELSGTLVQREMPGYPPGMLDLGFPTVVTLSAPGDPKSLTGMTPEWMDGVAAGNK